MIDVVKDYATVRQYSSSAIDTLFLCWLFDNVAQRRANYVKQYISYISKT